MVRRTLTLGRAEGGFGFPEQLVVVLHDGNGVHEQIVTYSGKEISLPF